MIDYEKVCVSLYRQDLCDTLESFENAVDDIEDVGGDTAVCAVDDMSLEMDPWEKTHRIPEDRCRPDLWHVFDIVYALRHRLWTHAAERA